MAGKLYIVPTPVGNLSDMSPRAIETLRSVSLVLAEDPFRDYEVAAFVGEQSHLDPAGRLAELMRRHDVIDFLVGTRINEAHQDPNLPVDLELRRNIVKRLGDVLRKRYMKEVNIHFV
mgnify:CR=1 FL=1